MCPRLANLRRIQSSFKIDNLILCFFVVHLASFVRTNKFISVLLGLYSQPVQCPIKFCLCVYIYTYIYICIFFYYFVSIYIKSPVKLNPPKFFLSLFFGTLPEIGSFRLTTHRCDAHRIFFFLGKPFLNKNWNFW